MIVGGPFIDRARNWSRNRKENLLASTPLQQARFEFENDLLTGRSKVK
jgi:hypothetical protein